MTIDYLNERLAPIRRELRVIDGIAYIMGSHCPGLTVGLEVHQNDDQVSLSVNLVNWDGKDFERFFKIMQELEETIKMTVSSPVVVPQPIR